MPALTPGQAVAAIAQHAILGDGSVTSEEQETLRGCLGDFPELWKAESIDAALKAVNLRVRKEGHSAILELAIPSVPRHLQGPLLAAVRELADSDGTASADEDALVARLSQAFVGSRTPARKR